MSINYKNVNNPNLIIFNTNDIKKNILSVWKNNNSEEKIRKIWECNNKDDFKYAILDENSNIFVSSDLIIWEKYCRAYVDVVGETSLEANELSRLIYGNNIFIALLCIRSSNFLSALVVVENKTIKKKIILESSIVFKDVIFDGNKFLFLTSDNKIYTINSDYELVFICTITDGGRSYGKMFYFNNTYYVVNYYGRVISSNDCITWSNPINMTGTTQTVAFKYINLTYENNTFVFTGTMASASYPAYNYYSFNGISWSKMNSTNKFVLLSSGNGIFISKILSNTYPFISTNGSDFVINKTYSFPSGNLDIIKYGYGQFVRAIDNNLYMSNNNCETWKQVFTFKDDIMDFDFTIKKN